MKNFRFIIYILSALFLSSCGEDRSKEYYALIEDDTWIEETMQAHYLWYSEMGTPTKNDFFAEPADFLAKILFKGNDTEKADKFSYIEEKTTSTSRSYLQRSSTYGFDFELMTDPTGITNHTFARVLFVLPNSPASESGLTRGTWISQIKGIRLTTDNYGYLMQGNATTFTTQQLIDVDGVLAWDTEKTLNIGASRTVEMNPFYVDTIYNIEGKKISYLVYNEFSTGPNNTPTDTQYGEQMKQIFAKFKSETPDAFILDLRYNPGGYLSCAQELGSLLVPSTALGKTFLTLQYNKITTPQADTIKYESNLAPYNMNLSKIYIITSAFTASASEAIINCLKPYMGDNVITIGETTVGKNVAMQPYTEEYLDFILWPVVAYTLNANNKADYSDGIVPTFAISERKYLGTMYPLGNINEYLLKNVISYILTGTMPDYTENSINTQAFKNIKASINVKKTAGLRIK